MTPTHIILSPHFDDAALSCGGLIHQARQAGAPVRVLTLFAGAPSPEQSHSPLAQHLHVAMGAPADVVALRKAEDRAAMAVLGADLVWLDFLDCPYRGRPAAQQWYYDTIADVCGAVHPEEAALPAQLAAAIRAQVDPSAPFRVYAPLGVGGHVDHQLTHQAAWMLWDEGWDLAFYEDYPYADPGYDHPLDAANPSTLETTLARIQQASLRPHLVPLTMASLEAKIESVMAYRSQLAFIFDDVDAIAHRMRAFAGRYVADTFAERYWMPAGDRR